MRTSVLQRSGLKSFCSPGVGPFSHIDTRGVQPGVHVQVCNFETDVFVLIVQDDR